MGEVPPGSDFNGVAPPIDKNKLENIINDLEKVENKQFSEKLYCEIRKGQNALKESELEEKVKGLPFTYKEINTLADGNEPSKPVYDVIVAAMTLMGQNESKTRVFM